MKHNYNIKKLFAISALSLLAHSNVFAQGNTVYQELDINNLRTRFYSGGSMFWDPIAQQNYYEVPKASGKSTIFAGGLWIGGYDQSGNLHVAAETYRQSGAVDYWSGPLDTTNATAANPTTWDLVWKVTRAEIANHAANWNQSGYVTPASILDWPGNAPSGSGYAPVLAPFVDLNNNQIYEPMQGEFPYIKGDQALYFIYNDNYAAHTETNCNAMRIEVHGMAYSFDRPSDPALNNAVFVNYQIGNRSNINYDSVYVGLWTDFDLGNASDDYAGTDVANDMYYAYNGDPDDEGANGYGLAIPAQGVVFLNQQLSKSMMYENNFTATGNPSTCDDYYQMLSGKWLDGTPWTYGGNGYNTGSTDYTNYMYPDSTDPAHPGQSWTEATAVIVPGDVRMLGSVYYAQLPAGGYINLEAAYMFAQASPGGPLTSVQLLQQYAGFARLAYNQGVLSVNDFASNSASDLIIAPNPVSTYAEIKFDNSKSESFVLTLFDVQGKKVFEQNNISGSKAFITKNNLSAGVYQIQLTSATKNYIGKVIIQ